MSGHTFVTGDTHGEIDYMRLSTRRWPEGKDLDRDDYVIIAGDFGILWSNDPKSGAERHLKNWYGNEKGWTTLFVDGNHENHKRLNQLPVKEMFGGKVGVVSDHIYHLKRGEIYTINGDKYFTFGGAMSWDKHHRVVDVSWWEEEECNHSDCDNALSNLEKHGWAVDYVITHTLPSEVIPAIGLRNEKNGKKCATANFLNHVARNLDYKEWWCGHFHDDKDLGKYHLRYYKIDQIK